MEQTGKASCCIGIARGVIAAAVCLGLAIFVWAFSPSEKAYASEDATFDYIWIYPAAIDLANIGDTKDCNATLYTEGTQAGLQYKSLNEGVATVDASGAITAKGIM